MTWRVGGGKSWGGHGDVKQAGEASLSEEPGGAHTRQQDVLGGVSTMYKVQGGRWGGGRGTRELLMCHWVGSWGDLAFPW